MNISYPQIHIRTCTYQGVRNVCLRKINTRFEIRPFALLPTNYLKQVCTRDYLYRNFSYSLQHGEKNGKKNLIFGGALSKSLILLFSEKNVVQKIDGEMSNDFGTLCY